MANNEHLRQARIARKIDQESLARILGVSTTTYARWETGQREPSLANLRMLCAYFQRPPEALGYVIYEQRAEHEGATTLDTSRTQDQDEGSTGGQVL